MAYPKKKMIFFILSCCLLKALTRADKFDQLEGYTHRTGDCPGHDIQNIRQTTLDVCAGRCNKLPNCKTFLFNDEGRGSYCWLKTSECSQLVDTYMRKYHFFNKIDPGQPTAGLPLVGPPTRLRITLKTRNPPVAHLTWGPPLGQATVDYYQIDYRRVDESDWTELHRLGGELTTLFLEKGATYEVAVAAMANGQRGEFARINKTIPEEFPTGWPREINTTVLSPTTVRVTWLPPPKATQNGKIIGYQVSYRKVGAEESSNTSSNLYIDEETDLGYTISPVDPGEDYIVWITAYNSVGMGPKSEVFNFNTGWGLTTKPELFGPYPLNTTVEYGGTATLECRVKSGNEPHIMWLLKAEGGEYIPGTDPMQAAEYTWIDKGTGVVMKKNESYVNKLVITDASEKDSGLYLCHADNGYGQAYSKAAYLTVLQKENDGSYVEIPSALRNCTLTRRDDAKRGAFQDSWEPVPQIKTEGECAAKCDEITACEFASFENRTKECTINARNGFGSYISEQGCCVMFEKLCPALKPKPIRRTSPAQLLCPLISRPRLQLPSKKFAYRVMTYQKDFDAAEYSCRTDNLCKAISYTANARGRFDFTFYYYINPEENAAVYNNISVKICNENGPSCGSLTEYHYINLKGAQPYETPKMAKWYLRRSLAYGRCAMICSRSAECVAATLFSYWNYECKLYHLPEGGINLENYGGRGSSRAITWVKTVQPCGDAILDDF